MGFVYFLRSGPAGAIKIGFTGTTPMVRLAALQTGNPEPLQFLGAIHGSHADEQRLHERFRHLHVHGEWFRAEADLLAFIEGARMGQREALPYDALLPWEAWFEELAQYVQIWLAREYVDDLTVGTTLAPDARLSDVEMEALERCRRVLIMGAASPGQHNRADLLCWITKAEHLMRHRTIDASADANDHADAGSGGGGP